MGTLGTPWVSSCGGLEEPPQASGCGHFMTGVASPTPWSSRHPLLLLIPLCRASLGPREISETPGLEGLPSDHSCSPGTLEWACHPDSRVGCGAGGQEDFLEEEGLELGFGG